MPCGKRRYIALLFPVLLIAAVVGVLLQRSNAAASPLGTSDARVAEQATKGTYRWSYSIKFVCGYQPEMKLDPGVVFREPVVKPGNYATDININNPQGRELALDKWITIMVHGEEVLARSPTASVRAPSSIWCSSPTTLLWMTAITCGNWRSMPMPPPPASSLTVGYLVIQSPLELDIDAVYTAEVPGGVDATGQVSSPTGISIDVERVNGKRVFVPAGQP